MERGSIGRSSRVKAVLQIRAPMRIQVTNLSELLTAFSARVRFQACMKALVYSQRRSRSECRGTVRACERPLAGVCPLVTVECSRSTETLIAFIAWIRLFAAVSPEVRSEVFLGDELQVALGTGERLLSGVLTRMDLEIRGTRESLSTLFARKWLRSGVRAHVS